MLKIWVSVLSPYQIYWSLKMQNFQIFTRLALSPKAKINLIFWSISLVLFFIEMSYQHSVMLNYITQPAQSLLFKQYCPVARVHFPVAMDILVWITTPGAILWLICVTNIQMCWIMLLDQLCSFHISNTALLLGSSSLLLWTSCHE